jgi:hypothetical protein
MRSLSEIANHIPGDAMLPGALCGCGAGWPVAGLSVAICATITDALRSWADREITSMLNSFISKGARR